MPASSPDRFVPLALAPAVLLLGVLFLGGMSVAVLDSVRPSFNHHLFTLEHYRALLVEPELRASILTTFLISTIATLAAACLGLVLALTLRHIARGSRLLKVLLQIPIAIPHLAMAVLVLDVLGQSGLVARIFYACGLITQPSEFPELLHDRYSIGIILTYVIKETPFIALVVLATLRRSIEDYEWVAATLGASPWQRFRRVTLPLIAPSLVSAALIVFVFIFGSFEVPFLLGRSYPPMLGVLVQRRYLSPQLGDRPDAIAAGVLMSLVSALFVMAYLRLSVRLAGGKAGSVLRPSWRLADAASITLVAILATLPIIFLTVYSFGRSWLWPEIAPPTWDASAWKYVLSRDSGLASSLAASSAIAAIVSLLSMVIALPGARALAWREFPAKRALWLLLFLPVLSPPLAAAMGLHAIFLRVELEDTLAGVVLVHLVPALPYTILMLAGSFSRLDPDLEAQARTLGASPAQVFRRVTLPAIAPGAAVAAAFAFLLSWSQYLITLLVGGGRVVTLPLTMVSFLNGGNQAIAAALTLVFILPTIFIFVAVSRFLRYDA